MTVYVLAVVLGLAAGVLAGMFGVGGGVLMLLTAGQIAWRSRRRQP